jgi:hypothetical protein
VSFLAEQATVSEMRPSDPTPNITWTEPMVRAFIQLYHDYEHLMENKSTPSRAVWVKIASDMINLGHCVTSEQCDGKFKSLKKRYKAIKDAAACTGAGRQRPWPYFDLMNNLMGNKPEMAPLATASSCQGFVINPRGLRTTPRELEEQCGDNEDEITKMSTPKNQAGPRKRKRVVRGPERSQGLEPEWLKTFREERKQQHEERMMMQREALDLMRAKKIEELQREKKQ